jgi:RNA polymerase sigma-70 factor (ECF subfamily)
MQAIMSWPGAIHRAGFGLQPLRDAPHCNTQGAIAKCLGIFRQALDRDAVDSIEDRQLAGGDARDLESRLGARSRELRNALTRYFQQRMRDSNEVEDLVQETFLRIVKRGNCDELEQLDGYIFQTAASVLVDRARRRKARASDKHVPFEPELHSEVAEGPDLALLNRESLRSVGAILLELPERTRQVFVLRRLEEMSYKEIAIRLGLSVSAIEKHMLHATRHLVARTSSQP